MLELYDAIEHIPLNEEARKLANDYIARSVFTLKMQDDALHVPCASVAGCPLILSSNFRHLVNRRRRLLVNLVNNELGYPSVDMLTPAEVYLESQLRMPVQKAELTPPDMEELRVVNRH